ncbi:MAG: FAD-dependent oxidoreductase, partial [Candidatus Alcyoniella australis]|nr:FAD-dependent oxidoreductase [Candidatus Alcyoniella australis]
QARAEAARCMACGGCSECMQCVQVCEAQAIIHDMQPEQLEVEAGAILLTPGYDPFDARLRPEYGYGRYKNVVTSLEFERMLSSSGPSGGETLRPSDNRVPQTVAWIQCVGSRDVSLGNDYCSGVCCMYAMKEALLAAEHTPGLRATIFHNDVRAFGKGFDVFYDAAAGHPGVEFQRGIVSSVKQQPGGSDLLLSVQGDDGRSLERTFELVVLSVGLRPSAGTAELAKRLGVELNRFGFCRSDPLELCRTSRDGIYSAGAFSAPMDIPETVTTAGAAAALAAELLHTARGSLVREKTYPPERDVAGEEQRIGVFVCRCGNNIAQTVDVPRVTQYARDLPGVVHAEENLHTCSVDTQRRIVEAIIEQRLNRVVVASCTPRTHEELFQGTLREAGLNKQLFEMANIRDQCSWVHYSDPAAATAKAEDLVRMSVARAATLRPFDDLQIEVDQRAIVIGGGVTGINAALSLADQGFAVALVEREPELGGVARRVRSLLQGVDARQALRQMIQRVRAHPLIELHLSATIDEFNGHVGGFRLGLSSDGGSSEVRGGAMIVATGGVESKPEEYAYGEDQRVLTQLDLEARLDDPGFARGLNEVAMIQCVGSREPQHNYCSRVCCRQAIKNAIEIKEANPAARVYILYRDIRTYGFDEVYYRKAREIGVVFVRFDPQHKPQIEVRPEGLRLRVRDEALGADIELRPDWLVLSAAIRPQPDAAQLSQLLKVPRGADGFYMEAHLKLRPLDFSSEGIFLAGLAHAPKSMAESIIQAKAAAARAATIISQPYLHRSGVISEVDQSRCVACLTCVRVCPYEVPLIDEHGAAFIEPASCQGCGICAASCPRKAIVTRHFADGQLLPEVDALLGDAACATCWEGS